MNEELIKRFDYSVYIENGKLRDPDSFDVVPIDLSKKVFYTEDGKRQSEKFIRDNFFTKEENQ